MTTPDDVIERRLQSLYEDLEWSIEKNKYGRGDVIQALANISPNIAYDFQEWHEKENHGVQH